MIIATGVSAADQRAAKRHCRQCTAQSGSSFTASFALLPREKRQAMTALYAFCREVDDIVDSMGDPEEAQARLDEWRAEIAALYAGRPSRPVALALAPAIERWHLPRQWLLDIVDGMEMDLQPRRYADFAALNVYCYRVASVVGLLAASIFGYREKATLEYAKGLGLAFQLINIVRDVGEDAARGRIYLPQDELARFAVREEEILACEDSERFQALMAFQIARIRAILQRALATLPPVDRPSQKPGLVMAATYGRLLDEIERQKVPVLSRRVRLSRAHKLWLLIRTWLSP